MITAKNSLLAAQVVQSPTIAKSVIHPRFAVVDRPGIHHGQAGTQVDPGDFRATLGCFPTGVAVITSLEGKMPVGMVVGSFSSISLDPPLVGFFAGVESVSYGEISRSSRFLVNVLGAEHDEACRQFFRDRDSRFQSPAWGSAENGLPKFSEAIAWINCTIVQETKIGDHVLVVGQVEDLARNEDKVSAPALVFHRGEFGASRFDDRNADGAR